MDVMQNNMLITLENQNKYPFQLEITQGYGTFSRDFPSGLASYGSWNLDILAQNIMSGISMSPKGSQGFANIS